MLSNLIPLSALRRLVQEIRPYRGQIIVVVVLGFIISAIQPVSVRLSQSIIDELNKGMHSSLFRWVPFALVALFVVSGLSKYFYNTIRRVLSERVLYSYRQQIFNKFLNLPMSTLDQRKTGDMLSTLQQDLAQVNGGLETLSDIVKEPVTFLGLIGVAFWCDWKLTLCTLLVTPLVAWFFSWCGAAVKRYGAKSLVDYSDLVSLSQEALSGSRIVKVFHLEDELRRKFNTVQERYFRNQSKSIRVQELATPTVELIGSVLIAGVLVYGSIQASRGELTSGQLVAFVVALGLAQMPLKQLNNANLKLKIAEAALDRIHELLEYPEQVDFAPSATKPGEILRAIEFSHVGLKYDGKPALHDISFLIERGQCFAFVGQSGSGKTTLVNCLARLYEITSGEILIDGVDIRRMSLVELRGLISYVTQDVFLFNDSIYENIRFGRADATRDEVLRAAELAHCNEFIAKCPQGIETRIGDRGVCLSGGERQRLAIARAILKGAPILVLDEATSNLDTQSEALVQDALEELMEGKTTFVVAHRLSTVKKADQILVLEDGKVIERGTHQALLEQSGAYAQYLSGSTPTLERRREARELFD